MNAMSAHDLRHTFALMERTPAMLNALLRDLPETWTHRNEGGESWNAYDIVGHLIYDDKTVMARVKLILAHRESEPFEPFDRHAQFRDSKGKTLLQLLDEFAKVRAEMLKELRALDLTDEQLALKGTHPLLGTVTLSQLLATCAAHDLTHLHQLTRVMAYQYRDAVGPWTKFLGVMKCKGHSE